jgi:RNA polymerase sigma-70 factor (ECF subfamily)
MAAFLDTFIRPTDEQLMWRVKLQDDTQAFATLMDRWQTPIERLGLRMTGDLQRAEDIAQTAFTRVFAHRAEWQAVGKFSTFLWQIALNLCRDELRRIRRRAECSLDALNDTGDAAAGSLPSEEPTPAARAELSERAEMVRRAVVQLDGQYREIVVLRHYEQLKFREIAEVLGIPEGTVKTRMSEALSRLNLLLKHLNESSLCNPPIRPPEVLAL